MYAVIWASFFEILVILFQPLGKNVAESLHVLLGIAVLALAYYASTKVRATACPQRIKRIAKTTANFAIAQAVLGIILFALDQFNANSTIQNVFAFFHVAIALTIIAQASSSATSYDMWEEKEFEVPVHQTPAV